MKSLLRTAAFMLVILLVLTSSVYAVGQSSSYVILSVNGEEFATHETTAKSVGEFLIEQGIESTDVVSVSCSLETPIKSYMMVKVDKAFEIQVSIDGGEPFTLKTKEAVAGDFIEKYSEFTGLGYGCDDEIADVVMSDGYELNLVTSFTEVFTETEYLPFETVRIADRDITEQIVASEGRNGERVTKTEVVYEDGKLVDSNVVYDNVDLEPAKRVVFVPATKAVSSYESEEIIYAAHYTMKATAYTLAPCCVGNNPSGLTASGMKARVGVVAVDPKVIPLGTELYISGYGYAIAGDTGGSIKGNKIDLFFDTLNECYEFGVRQVEVYVIGN